jgi:hypothetical protein
MAEEAPLAASLGGFGNAFAAMGRAIIGIASLTQADTVA